MNHDLKNSYAKYLTDVLGINKIFLDSEGATKDIIFYVENYDHLSSEENDLLKKMIEALKLGEKTMEVYDLKNKSVKQTFLFAVYLVNNPQQFKDKLSNTSLVTFGPTILQVKTQLKKEAWTELQKVIAFFNQTS